jgi:hypothetical protein
MCLGNFLGNCNYRIGVIPMKAGVFSVNSMVSGPTTFPDSRLRIPNQPALEWSSEFDDERATNAPCRHAWRSTGVEIIVIAGHYD